MVDRSDTPDFVDQYRILASSGRDLSKFCREYELELEEFTRPLGLDLAIFEDLHGKISFDKYCRLLEVLSTVSGDDLFGLRYGQYFNMGVLGPFGYGWSQAPTLKDALYFGMKYARVAVEAGQEISLIDDGDSTILEWTYSPLITRREQYVDCAAAIVFRQLQNSVGRSFQLLSANFERAAPRDKSLHKNMFSKSVFFNADSNAFVFPSEMLKLGNPNADNILFELMSEQCQVLVDYNTQNDDIVSLLKNDLVKHMTSNDRAISDVARRFGMSERTLQRRLENAGTSFWDVFESTRDELSNRLLKATNISLSEISQRTGYSSQSAYTRAVKRWHGMSPGQLRRQLQSMAKP